MTEEIKRLAKQRELEEFIEDVIVPTEEVVEVRRGQKVNSERKFLPGYVLLRAKLTNEVYHLVKDVAKVTGFLGQNNKPMPLRQSEVDRILNQVHEGAGTSEVLDHLRDRRAGQSGRRSVRIVQRHRGRSGRRPFALEGRRFYFRSGHPGRTRVYAGGEGLVFQIAPEGYARVVHEAGGPSRSACTANR